ncbi:hypothetical protein F965_01845 [Acinetobacter schindleri NIPH 900]|uniref:Uncharacterized protein n=1 Tax=Acinetobacter schindleri NIPH 900 TaxID=1217675 RepID=N8XVU5_9GAMM|nr:hypothetical protein F965_01845 [Acinetobacter schindleri NIPH 900]
MATADHKMDSYFSRSCIHLWEKLLERLNEHYLHQTARRSCAYTQVMGSDLSKNLESCNQDI